MSSHSQNLRFDIADVPNFKEDYVSVNLEKRIFEYADQLLSGKFTFGYDSLPASRFDPSMREPLDWAFSDIEATNTFILYAYGLRPIYILANAFSKTKNSQYMDLAIHLLQSFSRIYPQNDAFARFSRNDHMLVERAENLIYFGNVARNEGYDQDCDEIIYDFLQESQSYLSSQNHYQRNHNHGILADKGLIISSFCLNNEKTEENTQLAITRLMGQIEFAFGEDGIHAENSFDYHMMISNQIMSIRNCLRYIGNPNSVQLDDLLKRTVNFMVYAIMPDLRRPIFGDSKGGLLSQGEILELKENIHMVYIQSKGAVGQEPPSTAKIFQKAGYLFIREHFNPMEFEQSTWLSMKAGFTSRVHKHKDDLSICFYSKGFDIFVDAGMYNYVTGNPVKKYVESVPAHSTIGMDGESYSIARANGEKFSIRIVEDNEKYIHALAISWVYDHVTIYRHLIYLRQKNMVIIYDDIHSMEEKKFSQYFHLGEKIQIIQNSKELTYLQLGGSQHYCRIRQEQLVDRVRILNGIKTDPMSLLSTGFSQYVETNTLQYDKLVGNGSFLTVIELLEFANSLEFPMQPVFFTDLGIKVEDIVIPIPILEPLEVCEAQVSVVGHTLQIINFPVNTRNTISIFKRNKTELVYEEVATAIHGFRYEFNGDGRYLIFQSCKNDVGELKRGVLAEIRISDGQGKVIKKFVPLHSPRIGKLSISVDDSRRYHFSVEIQFDYAYRVQWWIYKDGINQCSQILYNNPSFDYVFISPGSYVIMYSISNHYFGEFEINQTAVIEIM
jgi:hypothetical protein